MNYSHVSSKGEICAPAQPTGGPSQFSVFPCLSHHPALKDPAAASFNPTMDKSKTVEETHDVSHELHPFKVLLKFLRKLDAFGVETRGIERIPSYERSTNKVRQLITVVGLWISACGGLSSMSSFYLGPLLFGLGLKKTLITGLLGQAIGCGVAAYCSLMGPRSGCRQMVGARFLFGWWLVKLVCIASMVGVMGWSVVNCITGAQILSSMSGGSVPLVVAIVIIACVSLVISIGGIRYLLRVEAFLSIPVNIAFLTLYIVGAKQYGHLTLADSPLEDAATVRGNAISFFALCYSITSTWGLIASDYYILFPEDTPDVQIFFLTFLGILIPTTFVGVAGILIGNVALTYEPWNTAYTEMGMGGLLNAAFEPWGAGGKFLLCLIFLSLISNNILNTYSAAFGVQLLALPLARVPRWMWAILLTAVYLVLSIVGRYHFALILGNFLPMVGYWITMYFVMLLEENTIFRTDRFIHLYTKEFSEQEPKVSNVGGHLYKRNVHYNFDIWNDYDKLTLGYAATFAFAAGAAGAAVGMSQAYWIGPLAKKVGGEYGGDIAMWLCLAFSGVSYPGLRYLELKKFGK